MRRLLNARWVLVFIFLVPTCFVIANNDFGLMNLYGQMIRPERGAQKSDLAEAGFARAESQLGAAGEDIAKLREERDRLKKEVENAVSIKNFNKVCSEKYDLLQELNALKEKMLVSVKMEDYKDILSEKTNLAKEVARLKEANVRLGARIAEYAGLDAKLAAQPKEPAIATEDKAIAPSREESYGKPAKGISKTKETPAGLAERENLTKEIAGLNKSNAALEARLAEYKAMESKFAAQAKEFDAAAKDKSRVSSEKEILAKEISRLREENAMLQARLGEFSNMGPVLEDQVKESAAIAKERLNLSSERESLTKAMADIKQQNAALETRLADYEAMKAKAAERPKELEAAARENKNLSAQIESLKNELRNMVKNGEYNSVLADKERLTKDLQKFSGLSKELEDAVKANKELSSEIYSVKGTLDKLKESDLGLEAKLSQRSKELEDAVKANNDLSSEVVSLRGNTMNSVKVGEYNSVLAEKENLEKELEKLRNESPGLEEKLGELEDMKAKLAQASRELEEAAQAKDKLSSEIESLKAGSANMIKAEEYDRVLAAKEDLEKELEKVRASGTDMQDKVAEYKDMEAKLAAKDKDLDAVTMENGELTSEIESLKGNMQNMIKAEEYNSVFAERENLSKEVDRLKEVTLALEAKVSESGQVESKLAVMSSELDVAANEKRDMLTAMDALKKENLEVRTELKKLQNINARLEAELREKAMMAEESRQVLMENEAIKAEIDTLKKAIAEKDAKIEKLNVFNQSVVAALKTQTIMYEDADKANKKKTELLKEIDDLKEANAASAEKAAKLREVNAKLEALMKEQSTIFAESTEATNAAR